jgi:hypothetical protein
VVGGLRNLERRFGTSKGTDRDESGMHKVHMLNHTIKV